MANIQPYIDQIQNAVYGEEVRSSIINALENVNNDNNSYADLKKEVIAAKDTVDEDVNKVQQKINAASTALTNLQNATSAANTAKINLESATETANAAKANLTDTTNTANNAKSNVEAAIDNANTAKSNLDTSVNTANGVLQSLRAENASAASNIDELKSAAIDIGSIKEGLDESIQTAGDTKTALDKSTELAGTAKTELDTSTQKAGEAKTALDGSAKTAGEMQETLSATVKQAGTLDTSLGEKIETGTQLKTDLTVSGEKAVQDIQTAGSEQLGKMQAVVEEFTADREQIATNKEDIGSLKEDLSNKITKFYASSQGETHLADSDNGKIQDMMIYGKSSQDGTPTPENPVEIKSVMNPVIKVCGKNLFDFSRLVSDGVNVMDYEKQTITVPARTNNTGYNQTLRGLCPGITPGTYVLSMKRSNPESSNGSYFLENSKDFLTDTPTEITDALLDNHIAWYNNPDSEVENVISEIQIEKGSKATSYEPYHEEQTITLPYTLNAIPVSSGGNVTLNGQQYIADYVDVERGKLVKKLKSFAGTDMINVHTWGVNANIDNITGFFFYYSKESNGFPESDNAIILSTILRYDTNVWGGNSVGCAINVKDKYIMFSVPTYVLEDSSSDENACASFMKICENTNAIFLYSMASPVETDLTPEEIEAFKSLVTNYPVTNISVTSDQLDGYTVFNYPISLANGWNYVKQQLNDNRDYIYDMDLQSAEAYVNSEYAVALTELEV